MTSADSGCSRCGHALSSPATRAGARSAWPPGRHILLARAVPFHTLSTVDGWRPTWLRSPAWYAKTRAIYLNSPNTPPAPLTLRRFRAGSPPSAANAPVVRPADAATNSCLRGHARRASPPARMYDRTIRSTVQPTYAMTDCAWATCGRVCPPTRPQDAVLTVSNSSRSSSTAASARSPLAEVFEAFRTDCSDARLFYPASVPRPPRAFRPATPGASTRLPDRSRVAIAAGSKASRSWDDAVPIKQADRCVPVAALRVRARLVRFCSRGIAPRCRRSGGERRLFA